MLLLLVRCRHSPLGQRSPAIYHTSGGRVCVSLCWNQTETLFSCRFFALFVSCVVPIPPSIQRRTNGSNVSIARATMTTYGFIILWYHKYEIYECVCVSRQCAAVVYYFFVFLLWFSSLVRISLFTFLLASRLLHTAQLNLCELRIRIIVFDLLAIIFVPDYATQFRMQYNGN